MNTHSQQTEDIENIKKRFPEEWLLISNCETDPLSRPLKGTLVEHSRDKNEIYKKLHIYNGKLLIDFSGNLPKDFRIIT